MSRADNRHAAGSHFDNRYRGASFAVSITGGHARRHKYMMAVSLSQNDVARLLAEHSDFWPETPSGNCLQNIAFLQLLSRALIGVANNRDLDVLLDPRERGERLQGIRNALFLAERT